MSILRRLLLDSSNMEAISITFNQKSLKEHLRKLMLLLLQRLTKHLIGVMREQFPLGLTGQKSSKLS